MKKFHGIFSLVLIFAAVCIGVYAVAKFSVVVAAAYIGITVFFILVIIYAFCAKCVCRSVSCSHVFPGKLTKLFPDRKLTGYSGRDILLTLFSLLVILVFPQYWLWRISAIFVLFWILMSIAVAEILFFVCKNCQNKKCPICHKAVK